VFNAVGGRYVPPHQVTLTMWYAIAEPCHVSVLCIEVHDPDRATWSRRRCIGLAFRRVLISLISHEHLTSVVTSCGFTRGVGISDYSVRLWPINIGPTI
jgi:hypothetical protein